MMWLRDRLLRRTRPLDRDALREQMAQADPEMRRVRAVQHEAIGALTAERLAAGLAIRREREFWSRHREHDGGQPR